ncbi:MAG: choice-of-anchor Q domain-containing protein [Candidatus Wenzhouxiangella sp. M2_3B_020]
MENHRRTALAAAICATLGAGHAGAATFQVTNTNDSGSGSLRDALTQANANAEADVIDLSSISGQTITLTSGQLSTSGDEITIEGNEVTIDAGGNSRVVYSYGTDLVINDLTITGGAVSGSQITRGVPAAGGGIYSKYNGSLTLNNSTVTGNQAEGRGGGISHSGGGALSINDSTISDNTAGSGGGLSADVGYQDIRIRNSVISGNSAIGLPGGTERAIEEGPFGRGLAGYSAAGGVYLVGYYGNVSIEDSTITANTAGSFGGVAAAALGPDVTLTIAGTTISNNDATAGYAGGGYLASTNTSELVNSTISGNSATQEVGGLIIATGSGSYAARGDAPTPTYGQTRIDFSTVTANTSGSDFGGLFLSSNGSQTVNASVISGNSATNDPDIAVGGGAGALRGAPGGTGTADVTFSLIGVDPTTGTLNKDATSTSLTGANPQLGSLADNGGPTRTHLPAPGSPLLDAIPPGSGGCGTSVTADQRGEPRPAGTGCDIGAVERGGSVAEALPVPVLDRLGLLLMAGLLGLAGLLGFRRGSGAG